MDDDGISFLKLKSVKKASQYLYIELRLRECANNLRNRRLGAFLQLHYTFNHYYALYDEMLIHLNSILNHS